jgi:hypothetical protein
VKVEKDYEELLGLFNQNDVKYCIIGAFALAHHAKPRYTKDLDLLIEPSVGNAEKILDALEAFGFGALDLKVEDFLEPGHIIQLGYEPIRIDILTSVEGIDFHQIWKNRSIGIYGDQEVFFIGINELIQCKQISNRKQDQADLEILNEALKTKK